MDLGQVGANLREHAPGVIFLNVLLQQLGLPVPAVPMLLLAGSLTSSPLAFLQLLTAGIAASVIADALWYAMGMRFGYRVLSGLCRLSINPASCVSRTEARFIRWGLPSLVVAKFIPGFSTVAPPVAGALRMRLPGFLLAAGIGAGLWAGLALGAGWLLRDTVQNAILIIDRHTREAALPLLILLALWIVWKFWQKRRFEKQRNLPHIQPAALFAALQGDEPPLFLDLRSPSMIAETGPLAGATVTDEDRLLNTVADWPKDKLIVTLCACPEDAGAVAAARSLQAAGYRAAKPLAGGYAAWIALHDEEAQRSRPTPDSP